MTDDGVRCALECDCVRWGRHDLPPQAGIGVCERGPDGLLATARVYDDVERAVEHRSRPIELPHDSARRGTLEFTAGSITGPAAEIVASAVNESPAGQVTVTSVVKDLALGFSLDLAADPGSASPSGEQLQLFLARPPSTRGRSSADPGCAARRAT